MAKRVFETVIMGGGPAGMAVLLGACRSGELEELLDKGLAIVEATQHFGAGQIGHYAINSDSTAATFIDCITNNPFPELRILRDHPLFRLFSQMDQNAVLLGLVGQLSLLIGEALRTIITSHPLCAVYLKSKVIFTREERAGTWRSFISLADGQATQLVSRNIIVATGGHQPAARLQSERVAGSKLFKQCGGRLMQSGEVLRTGGVEAVARRLAGKPNPKLLVLGGSTSAVSVTHTLLNRLHPALDHPNAVSLLHRRPLRIYYPSAAGAIDDGYEDFTSEDLCPLTNRVFRFAGLRLDQKEIICQALQIGGRQPDPRLRLHHLQPHDPEALQMIAESDLVIACFGYRPVGLKLADKFGSPIKLYAETSAQAPLVDEDCRVLDENRSPIRNIFGIGLAAGFTPRGALGGEPSFSGQANGLWLWQTAVGRLIIDQILAKQPVETRHGFGPGIADYAPRQMPETRIAQAASGD